ncbi:IS91 family transposase, partial [Desulfatirhabdium butyrativorans]|uniref:IS91 family transposase n=1 Tax=Desulfatirhabdium butyrativorans TaxID=340467 RepID=UPI0012EB7515
CPDCHHEYLLAFSCRGRWFCPSCHSKKVVQFAHHLKEAVIFPVPHRQYVFSIPKILRKFFLYDRKLLGKLCRCASKSITKFLKTVLGKRHGIPGIVMVIQTFGDYARWHPHLHALVADGLFLDSGYFYVMPKVDIRRCAELFRAYVLKMLKKEELIDDAFIKMIMKWRHNSGFSVHHQVRIKPEDEKGIENLSQYIIRNTFSNSKIQYVEETETVLYRSKMSHGKNKKNFQVFDPLEFIAAITQHIPEKSFQLVRYYGWYSNRMRGDRKKQEQAAQGHKPTADDDVIDIRSCKSRRIPPLMWRECIKKIWEVDPLLCKHCGSEMKIISFIYERTVIKKILVHLHLYSEPKQQRAPPAPEPENRVREYASYDDGWPGYEEPSVDVNSL